MKTIRKHFLIIIGAELVFSLSGYGQEAGRGYGAEALEVLRGSAGAALLEPLVVGLQMDVGEEVLVAQEIMEIGRDVALRIGERRKELVEKQLK